ncbi:helix-turn-helix domain-containing protein [Actinomadura rayongensis]|uniref:Helix-turn-helix domain-containing protein n=1 Tax=Actinomadura rayongensis TaxID=1429076 RepID=A0A6I4WGM9_9ACTN|nr:helix-turn-helix transcriptional regulator [Actinomadura rayongensis]MXQ66164.1 hypothetical protein [Actinomadura rayongensis]
MEHVDPDGVHGREELLAGLRRLFHEGGWSVHRFAAASGLGTATIQGILDGSTNVPQTRTLELFVRTCGQDSASWVRARGRVVRASKEAAPTGEPSRPPRDGGLGPSAVARPPSRPGGRWGPRTAVAVAAVLLAAVGWAVTHRRHGSTGGPPVAVLRDVHRADPCSLLDAGSLAGFGATRIDPDYGALSRCDVLLSPDNDAEPTVDVDLHFDGPSAESPPATRTTRVGHVSVTEMPDEPDRCIRDVRLADGDHVRITAKRLRHSAAGLCTIAQAVTGRAVERLNNGTAPVYRDRFPKNSLALRNACDLLDDEALNAIPGADAKNRHAGFAGWDCTWDSATTDAGVDVQFNQDDDLDDDGKPVLLAGRRSHVAAGYQADHSCTVAVEHRHFTDAAGDPTVEFVMLTVYGPQANADLCTTAEALGTSAASKLPDV